MNKRFSHAVLVAATLIGALMLPPSLSAGEVTLRYGHTGNKGDDVYLAPTALAAAIERHCAGLIKIKLYGGGVLGNSRVQLENVQRGGLDLAQVGQAQLTTFLPDAMVLDLPYIVRADTHDKLMKEWLSTGKLFRYIDKEAGKIGLKLIIVCDSGFRHYAFVDEVTNLDEMKGIKVRSTPSAVDVAITEAFGMQATPLPWGELYTALQQGTVKGEVTNLFAFVGAKRNELESHIVKTSHLHSVFFTFMNKKRFDGLSPEAQKKLMQAADETALQNWTLIDESEKESEKWCKEHNIVLSELSDADVTRIMEMMKPVYEKFKDKGSPEFIKLLEEIQK